MRWAGRQASRAGRPRARDSRGDRGSAALLLPSRNSSSVHANLRLPLRFAAVPGWLSSAFLLNLLGAIRVRASLALVRFVVRCWIVESSPCSGDCLQYIRWCLTSFRYFVFTLDIFSPIREWFRSWPVRPLGVAWVSGVLALEGFLCLNKNPVRKFWFFSCGLLWP